MFCPNCGQERISESTSFCSRCGYLLTGTADLLKMGGSLPTLETPNGQSQRSRGVKQGLFVMILGVALFPIIGILTTFLFHMTPWPAGVVLFTLFFGGLLRMAYALMFEPKYPQGLPPAASLHIDSQLTGQQANSALPPTSFVPPVTGKTGRWLDTNELEPHSVTESTTKLLELEDDK